MNQTTKTNPQVVSTPAIECKLGWVIVYVDAPTTASDFYAKTFGLRAEFAAPDGSYAQLDTGPTKLAFASYGLGEKNFAGGVRRPAENEQPPNCELTIAAEDIDAVYATAVAAGCTALAEPTDKPHGQRVAYVRDPFGTLLELATPL
jgi:lactoylglutathione lyase